MTDLPRFDVSEFIDTPEAEAALLADAFESGDPAYITHALGIIARARGMTQVARDAGVSREALYKAFGGSGDPKLSTLLGVMRSIGVRLTVEGHVGHARSHLALTNTALG